MVVIRRMKPKRNNRLLYFGSIIVVIIVVFLSVGFSAFLNQLFIDDISLNVRVDRDIRVSGVFIFLLLQILILTMKNPYQFSSLFIGYYFGCISSMTF